MLSLGRRFNSSVDPFPMLEKYTAQGLFRKQFLILQLLFLSTNAKGVFWFLEARLAEFYSQKFKVTFMCLLSDTKKLLSFM